MPNKVPYLEQAINTPDQMIVIRRISTFVSASINDQGGQRKITSLIAADAESAIYDLDDAYAKLTNGQPVIHNARGDSVIQDIEKILAKKECAMEIFLHGSITAIAKYNMSLEVPDNVKHMIRNSPSNPVRVWVTPHIGKAYRIRSELKNMYNPDSKKTEPTIVSEVIKVIDEKGNEHDSMLNINYKEDDVWRYRVKQEGRGYGNIWDAVQKMLREKETAI
jgi:hypothetical protein